MAVPPIDADFINSARYACDLGDPVYTSPMHSHRRNNPSDEQCASGADAAGADANAAIVAAILVLPPRPGHITTSVGNQLPDGTRSRGTWSDWDSEE